jgi:hypothetical protein
LQKLQARKAGENAKRETRVSTSDPQAHVMKQSDKGFALCYNARQQNAWPFRGAARRKRVGDGVPQENGQCRSPAKIPLSRKNREILSRMDQKQAGLRQFHVRGLVKTQMEMMWACLRYNLQHWIRLRKLHARPVVT